MQKTIDRSYIPAGRLKVIQSLDRIQDQLNTKSRKLIPQGQRDIQCGQGQHTTATVLQNLTYRFY
jgi:hypothetical protein